MDKNYRQISWHFLLISESYDCSIKFVKVIYK